MRGPSQLRIHRFKFGPSYQFGCQVKSSIADNVNGLVPHLNARRNDARRFRSHTPREARAPLGVYGACVVAIASAVEEPTGQAHVGEPSEPAIRPRSAEIGPEGTVDRRHDHADVGRGLVGLVPPDVPVTRIDVAVTSRDDGR